MKSLNDHMDEGKIKDFFRKDNRPKINISGWTAKIRPAARGLEMVAIDPKTGEEVFMMSGSIGDRDKMNKLAKEHGLKLEESYLKEYSHIDSLHEFDTLNKIYPDSYLRNKVLMDLVKKHTDPIKFLLDVMTAMSKGKLRLAKIGVASTREVAALWNDYNNAKITEEIVENVLQEARALFVKGWTKKNKIVTKTDDFDNYHIIQVITNSSKFGLNEKKILKILEDWYEDMSAPDPEEEAQKILGEMHSGVVDNSPPIEEYLFKKGYCRFTIDKTHGSVEGQTEKECRESANILDDTYLPYERDGFKLFEIKPVKPFKPKYITSKYDWNDWLQGKKQRKYVSKMAQFREWIIR